MDKLTQVLEALQKNPNLVILGFTDNYHLPDMQSNCGHSVEYYVAPKVGIYTAPELQAFMEVLMPEIEQSSINKFYMEPDRMFFGRLNFKENIGTRKVLFMRDEATRDVERHILVRLFPDIIIAESELIYGFNRYFIYLERLELYRMNMVQPLRRAS